MMRPSLWIGAEPLELTAIVEAVAREERGPGNSRPPGGLGGPGGLGRPGGSGGSGNSVEGSPNEGSNAGADGAVVTFFGLVRNRNAGRSIRYLEYEAYEPLALRAFERIASEIRERWPDVRLALHHRVGRLAIGEASVAIATRAPHRGNAYAACRYAIERVKQIAPIWKREFFTGGDIWIEGATADPDDARARAEAERVACA